MSEFLYLVVLHYPMDDVPLLLTECSESAIQFAEEIAWETMDVPLAGVLDLPNISSPPCSISVVTFRNGTPCGRVVVREFDEAGEAID